MPAHLHKVVVTNKPDTSCDKSHTDNTMAADVSSCYLVKIEDRAENAKNKLWVEGNLTKCHVRRLY